MIIELSTKHVNGYTEVLVSIDGAVFHNTTLSKKTFGAGENNCMYSYLIGHLKDDQQAIINQYTGKTYYRMFKKLPCEIDLLEVEKNIKKDIEVIKEYVTGNNKTHTFEI